MLRILSATECSPNKEQIQTWFKNPLKNFAVSHSLEGIETLMDTRKNLTNLMMIKDVKEDMSKVIVRPWFYDCNPERYPAWLGMHDTRVT